jgi:hypothetical protein
MHWKNPKQFDPERYLSVPTSAEIDEDKCRQIGLARCPFDITTVEVKDGRKVGLSNSGFGTVFGIRHREQSGCGHEYRGRGGRQCASRRLYAFLR